VVATVPSSPSSSSNLITDFMDLRLLQYYIQECASTLSLDGAVGRTWSQDVPQLAFGGANYGLLHSMLAVSATRILPNVNEKDTFALQGQIHYGKAISLLRQRDLTARENVIPTLATIMLLSWYEVHIPFPS